ncbi:Dynamin family protein [Modestobacter sp. DSM 44400]|uniref:dynamin family protein n=1 Tax=Modestobacter sp. DSM 44400 TaxID=1550230 RepID=UPI00089990BD|nr:dynamin family protein [Modestobacter sp. DSM 44400]SDY18153.1 Dynamin family protein [Modestobacter sp. DSM 44400]
MAASLELLDRALGLAGRCDRPDLHRRLTVVKERVQTPSIRVLVVGEPKQGKSFLVNALVGAPVCAVGDDVATTVPTVVRHGDTPAAALVFLPREASGVTASVPEQGLSRVTVPLERLAGELAGGARAADGSALVRGEVQLPRKILAGGLEVVDTAGVGGLGSASALGTVDMLPSAHAVLVVSDASQEYTAPEMVFIRQAAALCPNVACVLTKIDANPEWRTIMELDRGHLAAAGIQAPMFAVSSSLEVLAVQRQDQELHEESGVGALVSYLRREIVGRADSLAQRSTMHDLTSVTEQLGLALNTELTALQDPASTAGLLAELETARAGVDDLRRRSSRWQQLLTDGVTDLMADIDYDLRDRTRAVTREADDAIESHDPGPLWDDFTGWMDRRVAAAVAESFVWASQRSEWLADQVVEQFAKDGGAALPDLSIGDATEMLGSLVELSDIDRGVMKLPQRLLIGMRGSYSGVLMTGLITSLAGMAVINPISVGVGLVIGSKAYRDDKQQRRQRRQNEAKSAVRRHLDEVVFQASKQLKDRLRYVQRTLRDMITDTVDEMSRTLADAVKVAQQSAKGAAAERDARMRALRQQLDQIERLRKDVSGLTGNTVPGR